MSATNLDFLKVGGLYPPTTEVERLAKYNRYDEIFKSNMGEAYTSFIKDHTRDQSIANQMLTLFSNPRIMNYGRAITKKTVDLMFSRKPNLMYTTTEGDNALIEVVRTTKAWKKIKTAFIDVSRYGDGFVREYNKVPRKMEMEKLSDGVAACNVINPSMVTLVVNPLDKEDITNIVIGWVDKVDKSYTTNGVTVSKPEYYLTVEIHSAGEYEYRRFKVSDPIMNAGAVKQYYLQEDVTPENLRGVKFATGLKGFAVKHYMNFNTSDNPLEGLSDYDMFDSLMIDLCQRVSQLSEVFEKHGNPSMQGSPELMSRDENGDPIFYAGDFYPISEGQKELSYITWDSKSKEVIDYCNNILKQIFILSEMGDGSIMGYTDNTNGFAESGKGLRMKMASPLMKAQSLMSDNDDEIIGLIHDCSVIMGKDLKVENIEVKWNDGLPIDWTEETNNFDARVQANTESIVYGLQRRFGMTPEQASDEFEQILKELKQKAENTSFMQENALQNKNEGANIKSETREETENRLDGKNSAVDIGKKANDAK